MPYTPIVATLGYVLSPDRRQVLMIHRNTRPGDHHLGKYNGLGGKIDFFDFKSGARGGGRLCGKGFLKDDKTQNSGENKND